MAVLANRFGGLQSMDNLRQSQVGIAVVHELVHFFQRFPDAQFLFAQHGIFGFLVQDEGERLMLVVQMVKLFDCVAGFGGVVTKNFRCC